MKQIKIFFSKHYLTHLLICMLGFIALTQALGEEIGLIFDTSTSSWISYSDSARLVADHSKVGSLLQYIFLIGGLFLYFIFLLIIDQQVKDSDVLDLLKRSILKRAQKFYFATLFIFNFLLLLAFIYIPQPKLPVIFAAALIWLCFFLWPFMPLYQHWLERIKQKQLKFFSVLATGILVLVMVQVFHAFWPYLGAQKLEIANDYFGVPEQTYLDGALVDNTTYIKQHHIGDLYSPGRIVENATLAEKLIQNKDILSDDLNSVLCLYFSKDQCDYLLWNNINLRVSHQYDAQEKSFIANNLYELKTQLIAGHYFHHQNAILAPLSAYLLEKPLNQITFLYGFGNTIVLAKLISFFGTFNFETFTHVLFAFYPAYYLLLLVVAWFIFRDIFLVMLVMLLSVAALQFIGFEAIRYAPGTNPIRHFMDLFVIVSFFQYLRAKSHSWFYLSLTFIFALISIWANKEFGAMIFIALSIAFLSHLAIANKDRRTALVVFLLAIIAAIKICLSLRVLGEDPLAIYGLLGVSVAPTSIFVSLAVAFALLVSYLAFFYAYLKGEYKAPWFYLALFLFLYFQGSLVYFIWYTELAHLLSASSISFVLMLTLFLQQGIKAFRPLFARTIVFLLVTGVFMFLYLSSLFIYVSGEKNYRRIFATHRLYTWDFPRAHFISTMNPAPFENAVRLIQHYNVAPSIYMISRYDNFLPFLSDKYLALPYLQLDLSIVSQKEFNAVINNINQNKPKYIFVDSDIQDTHFSDILNRNDPVNLVMGPDNVGYNMSAGRVLSLLNLKRVFDRLNGTYHKVAEGNLISVYQRNDT